MFFQDPAVSFPQSRLTEQRMDRGQLGCSPREIYLGRRICQEDLMENRIGNYLWRRPGLSSRRSPGSACSSNVCVPSDIHIEIYVKISYIIKEHQYPIWSTDIQLL